MRKKAKGAIIGSVAGLAALAVGVGLWQPWKAETPDTQDTPAPPVVEQPAPKPPEEEPLTLNVGGEKIPCTLYEGDGWSICVPEGWYMSEAQHILAPRGGPWKIGVRIESVRTYDAPAYTAIGRDVDGFGRTFYSGTEQGSWYVHTRGRGDSEASRALWYENEKLLTAVARSFALDGEKIFANVPLAQEPDWQIVDGEVILWLDKDGYPVSEEARRVMEDSIRTWYPEAVGDLSGLYRLMGFDWTASYAGLTDGYVDVFSGLDCYAVKPGGEAADFYGDMTDGWYYDSYETLNLAVFHDGGDVEKTKVLRGELVEAWKAYVVRELLGEGRVVGISPAASDLLLEVSNVEKTVDETFVDDGGTEVPRTVLYVYPGAELLVRDADMSDPAYAGGGKAHPQWGLLWGEEQRLELTDGMDPIPVPEGGCMVYSLESSVGILELRPVE